MNVATLSDAPTRESALTAAAAILSRRIRDALDEDRIAVAIASRVRHDDVDRARIHQLHWAAERAATCQPKMETHR